MSDYSILSRRHAGSFFPWIFVSLEGFRKKGGNANVRGNKIQARIPRTSPSASISSQNRTLFVSTPTAVITTAIPSDGFHAAQSTSNGLTLHHRLCGHRPTLTKEFKVPEHITNLHPTAVRTILVKIYYYNNIGIICTVSFQVLLAEKCMKKN